MNLVEATKWASEGCANIRDFVLKIKELGANIQTLEAQIQIAEFKGSSTAVKERKVISLELEQSKWIERARELFPEEAGKYGLWDGE